MGEPSALDQKELETLACAIYEFIKTHRADESTGFWHLKNIKGAKFWIKKQAGFDRNINEGCWAEAWGMVKDYPGIVVSKGSSRKRRFYVYESTEVDDRELLMSLGGTESIAQRLPDKSDKELPSAATMEDKQAIADALVDIVRYTSALKSSVALNLACRIAGFKPLTRGPDRASITNRAKSVSRYEEDAIVKVDDRYEQIGKYKASLGQPEEPITVEVTDQGLKLETPITGVFSLEGNKLAMSITPEEFIEHLKKGTELKFKKVRAKGVLENNMPTDVVFLDLTITLL